MKSIPFDTPTDTSPCKDCPRHLAGLEKNECIDSCLALASYQKCEDWTGKPRVPITPVKKREYHRATVEFNPNKQVRGSLNLQNDGKCHIESCDRKSVVRGLCLRCGQSWRKGRIEHPVLGKFTVWQGKDRIKKEVDVKPQTEIKTPGPETPESEEEKPQTPEKPYLHPITIDFAKYPRVEAIIEKASYDFKLPIEHTIMNFLAVGARAYLRRDDEK